MTPICGEGFWKLGLVGFVAMGGAIAARSDCALAQITPDGTMGAESSVVTPTNANGLPSNQIDGGAARGANLFHSFEQFSVPTGGEASFNNALDIQNIISRVTGSSISNIDGLLRANASANLFLINPNGIIFGPNASLNIGGSFVGSTASSLNFADGTSFSASAHPTTPLLTVSVPMGLQYGRSAGGIQVQESILQVKTGQTLALMGGDVSVEGGEIGFLQAPGGRVELGGVAGSGTVGLHVSGNDLRLGFLNDIARADVSLTNGARVGVAGGGGGSIAVNARNLKILGGSRLAAGIGEGLGAVDSKAGNIEINASDTVSFDGGYAFNTVASGSVGNGGGINITTGSLSASNGAQLLASTEGQGDSGSVTITARDTVEFDDGYAYSNVTNAGNSGGINITTGSLSASNGAQLLANTQGQEDSASVTITARDTVSIDGQQTLILTTVAPEAVGTGGNIKITTGSLSVTNGAELSANTQGQGDAGNVTIEADDTVSIDGQQTLILTTVAPEAVGTGGNIKITTGSLSVTNGALLQASSEGSGVAGNIEVAARSIRLENQAFLSSDTTGGQGNIFLDSQDLVLRRESLITTNATGTATGGNITINSDVIAALENSDISADADEAFGGRITIDAQGIFGTEFRDAPTLESDITATGGSPELSGTVEINNPDVDPTQGLVELPGELVNASNSIATGCPDAVWRGESKFIITGRGGLPPSPTEPLRGDNTLTNWSTLEEPEVENRSSAAPSTNSTIETAPTSIVEANGWVKGPNGEVTLVATAPTANIDIPWLPESDCRAAETGS